MLGVAGATPAVVLAANGDLLSIAVAALEAVEELRALMLPIRGLRARARRGEKQRDRGRLGLVHDFLRMLHTESTGTSLMAGVAKKETRPW